MKEQRFRKEYATELIEIAFGDLESARGLVVAKMGRKENILYFAQQSIEKAFKAVLCALEKPIPITHDLVFLLDRLALDSYRPSSL